MVFVNEKLGNGFVINDAGSSKDQEHYFTGYKKTLELFISGLSGSQVDGSATNVNFNDDGTILFITGAAGAQSYRVTSSLLQDENNINFTDDMSTYFPDIDVTLDHFTTKVVFEASQSIGTDGLSVNFTVGDDEGVGAYVQFVIGGTPGSDVPIVEYLDDGWIRYTHQVGEFQPPRYRLDLKKSTGGDGGLLWFLFPGADGDVWGVRKLELQLQQHLSDNGVEVFKNLDNQKIEFQLLNPDVLTKVE